jgi:hypothetical protein
MNEMDKQHEAWLRGRARAVTGGWEVLAMIDRLVAARGEFSHELSLRHGSGRAARQR